MHDVHAKRLRVAGDVKEGSIQRNGREVRFVLKQEAETINVFYNGIDPLPDTFKDGAQAVADGKLNPMALSTRPRYRRSAHPSTKPITTSSRKKSRARARPSSSC
jgi:cytochrome c-type biogenesis protein CcmE